MQAQKAYRVIGFQPDSIRNLEPGEGLEDETVGVRITRLEMGYEVHGGPMHTALVATADEAWDSAEDRIQARKAMARPYTPQRVENRFSGRTGITASEPMRGTFDPDIAWQYVVWDDSFTLGAAEKELTDDLVYRGKA